MASLCIGSLAFSRFACRSLGHHQRCARELAPSDLHEVLGVTVVCALRHIVAGDLARALSTRRPTRVGYAGTEPFPYCSLNASVYCSARFAQNCHHKTAITLTSLEPVPKMNAPATSVSHDRSNHLALSRHREAGR